MVDINRPEPVTFVEDPGFPVDGPAPRPLYAVGGLPGGGGSDVTWGNIPGKPAVVAAGADAGAARTSIGAGTSSLAVATTAPAALGAAAAVGTGTTAARADHVHTLPTAAQVGAAPTSHTHAFTALTGTVAGATGANLQLILNDLATRLAAVETP